MSTTTPEQAARDMLEQMGVRGAQRRSAGDVVELANLIARERELTAKNERLQLVANAARAYVEASEQTTPAALESALDDLDRSPLLVTWV